jgi:hypothetical protein
METWPRTPEYGGNKEYLIATDGDTDDPQMLQTDTAYRSGYIAELSGSLWNAFGSHCILICYLASNHLIVHPQLVAYSRTDTVTGRILQSWGESEQRINECPWVVTQVVDVNGIGPADEMIMQRAGIRTEQHRTWFVLLSLVILTAVHLLWYRWYMYGEHTTIRQRRLSIWGDWGYLFRALHTYSQFVTDIILILVLSKQSGNNSGNWGHSSMYTSHGRYSYLLPTVVLCICLPSILSCSSSYIKHHHHHVVIHLITGCLQLVVFTALVSSQYDQDKDGVTSRHTHNTPMDAGVAYLLVILLVIAYSVPALLCTEPHRLRAETLCYSMLLKGVVLSAGILLFPNASAPGEREHYYRTGTGTPGSVVPFTSTGSCMGSDTCFSDFYTLWSTVSPIYDDLIPRPSTARFVFGVYAKLAFALSAGVWFTSIHNGAMQWMRLMGVHGVRYAGGMHELLVCACIGGGLLALLGVTEHALGWQNYAVRMHSWALLCSMGFLMGISALLLAALAVSKII